MSVEHPGQIEGDELILSTGKVYWNKTRDSLEIYFSEEETPVGRTHQHPIIFWETGDGRVMKMEIKNINFHY